MLCSSMTTKGTVARLLGWAGIPAADPLLPSAFGCDALATMQQAVKLRGEPLCTTTPCLQPVCTH